MSDRIVLRDPTMMPLGDEADAPSTAPVGFEGFDRVARIAVVAVSASAAVVSRIESGRVEILAMAPAGERPARGALDTLNRRAVLVAARRREIVVDATVSDGTTIAIPVRPNAASPIYVLALFDTAMREGAPGTRDLAGDLGGALQLAIESFEGRVAETARNSRSMLLFREMEHRVKNSLSTVQALVSLSLQGDASVAAMRDRLIERIGAMAKTQTLLLQDGMEGASLGDIVAAEAGHYGGVDRIRWRGPPVRIQAGDVTPIGMILHELGTNAAKHGALSPENHGRVEIAWRETREPGHGRKLRLEWRESGAAIAAPPETHGFGTTLLDLLVTGQLRGTIQRAWNSDGLVFACELSLWSETPRVHD